MHPVDRRRVLGALAASVALGVYTLVSHDSSSGASAPKPTAKAKTPTPQARLFAAPPPVTRAAIPSGNIYTIPGEDNRVALTIDDGTDPDVVEAYVELCKRTGMRLTFFVTGSYASWTDKRSILLPLVESGQILLGNHTWTHPDLTTISSAQLTDEVTRTRTFLKNTYGVTGEPFLRPPFGNTSPQIHAQCADMGYPAMTMWYGSLGDDQLLTSTQVLANATKWLQNDNIVIGHANHAPVITVMDQIAELIASRKLQPVHLGDVFQT